MVRGNIKMSSFLCFICHSTVNSDTKEEIREKYREVIGMNMCPNSHMCHICCHVLNKLFLFKSVCLKRSMEYPVLFSEKGTLNLQRNDIELQTICVEDTCAYHHHRNINSKTYHLTYQQNDKHVKFDDDRNDFDDYFDTNGDEQNLHELMHMVKEVGHIGDNTKYFDAAHVHIDNNCIEDFNYNENIEILPIKSPKDVFVTNRKEYVVNSDNLLINTAKLNINVNTKEFNDNFNDLQIISPKIDVNITNTTKYHVYNDNLCMDNQNIDARVSNPNEYNQNSVNIGMNSHKMDAQILNTKEYIKNSNNINVNDTKTSDNITNIIEDNQTHDFNAELNVSQVNSPKFVHETTDLVEDSKTESNNILDVNFTNIEQNNTTITNSNTNTEQNEEETEKSEKMKHKSKKKLFKKIVLTLEQQKMELESKRKEKKYLEAEFKCHNCALGFLFKDTYQAHMMRHEESNGEHVCPVCSLRFARASVLRSHVASHGQRHHCACGATVAARGRDDHLRKCAEYPLSSSARKQHHKRSSRAGASTRTYSCSTCGKSYNNQAAVRTHMIKHINRKFNCDQCNETYSSPYTLNQHKKKHGSQEHKQFHCTTCNTSYSTRKSLLAHCRNSMNHQQTIYECPVCTRTCPNQRSLTLHIESVHSSSLNYACPTCPNRYSNRKSLLRHIATHSGKPEVKIAVCHICGGSFKGNNKLNRHLREVCKKAKLEEELANLYDEELLNTG